MAPLLEDPRIRQTWNQLSQNAENATENAAAGIWAFQHDYISPCLGRVGGALDECAGQCFPSREERARRFRERGRTRGRAEVSFDFYDDWDEEESANNGGLLGGWGNDELDRLLAGSGSLSGTGDLVDQGPRRKRGMSYGTRGTRRKSIDLDPTVIPSTNALGFLGRLPWKLGGTLRYKPSAADLQEHPGALRTENRGDYEAGEPLMLDDDSGEEVENHQRHLRHSRKRSSTTSSGETSDSFRSRGDLFPSDGEDDAVPLDDTFAMALERRGTLSIQDDRSSGKTGKGKNPVGSRSASRNVSRTTLSSQTKSSLSRHRANSGSTLPPTPDRLTPDMIETLSLLDLQREEERIRQEEDEEVEVKRLAATRLAVERGLHSTQFEETIPEPKPEIEEVVNVPVAEMPRDGDIAGHNQDPQMNSALDADLDDDFVPARLPRFG